MTRTAHYLYKEKSYKKIVAVYDLNNEAYTKSWYQQLESDFESLGGKIEAVRLRSEPGKDFLKIVNELLKIRNSRIETL